ncbi:MAG: precorrin-6A synthase (deacetylating) [Chloroflexota bacterium]|nr:precorrin-6A synthase (deacetylating) [Rhodoglobus sp.]RJQ10209.1 MAG: precorrin-6A synthase (deacetylating) [Dehalococcoidia bacterium]
MVIGIGAGDPEYLTMQAIHALNRVDVFFVMDKRDETRDLVRIRQDICDRYITDRTYRIVEINDPDRDRTSVPYRAAVEAWRQHRAEVWEAAIRDELEDDGCGAFLVWGDPSLYDSTLGVIDHILARGVLTFEYEVIPGISSVQALAAKHRIALNRIGGPIQITTGRRLQEGFPSESDDVVVLLDGDCSFRHVAHEDLDIYWGAYVGTADEILVSGDLQTVMDDIERVRSEARARKGWIMDAYVLKRKASE